MNNFETFGSLGYEHDNSEAFKRIGELIRGELVLTKFCDAENVSGRLKKDSIFFS
jgi:hypothetical protein